MKKIACILFFFGPALGFCQLRHKLDSLLVIYKKNLPADTSLAKLYNEIGYQLTRIHPDSSKLFTDKGMELSKKLNFKKGIGEAYNNLGINYYIRGQFEEAEKEFLASKKIAEEMKNLKAITNRQNNLGIIYYTQGNYTKALEYLNRSLVTQTGMHDTLGLANTQNTIASVYIHLADYDKALKCYLEALNLFEKAGDKTGISQAYNNIGIVYNSLENFDKAIENYEASVKISEEIGEKFKLAPAYSNLGKVYQKKGNIEKATWYFTESLKLAREMNSPQGIAYNLSDLGSIAEGKKDYAAALKYYTEALHIHEKDQEQYSVSGTLIRIGSLKMLQGNLGEAQVDLQKALDIASQIKAKSTLSDCYQSFAQLYKKQKNFKKAFEFQNLYAVLRDSILGEEKNKSMAEMQTRFDTDKKEREIALLTKNKSIEELQSSKQQADIKKQRVAIYSSLGGITLALTLGFFVLKGNREKKKANNLLEEKNEAIRAQKQVLEEKNIQITDSIDYAKSIQEAILPSMDIFKEKFKDSFILFRPKDVVSGDFYWLFPTQKGILVAAVDCVGHGVPGAFMALHSYNLMERIAKEKPNFSPAEILDELNKKILESLNQQSESGSAKHGMDLALLKLEGNTISFSGARNPVVIVHGEELNEVKADRMYVGGAQGNFTNNPVPAAPGSMLYLFTDGYADQKGGPQNKKFFADPLRKLFKEIAHLPAEEQKTALEKAHDEWKGSGEQLDDILVIGIRV